MKELLKRTKYIFVCVLAISMLGCDADDFNLPRVTAGFTFTVVENSGVVTFINTSEEAQNFTWDFGNGNTSTEINPTNVYEAGTFTVSLTATNGAGGSDTFEDEITIDIMMSTFDSGLLVNGDFENGDAPWIGNALNIQTEGGNSFNFANVETAGNPFDVNLSQVVEITQGTNYILTFDASSDQARTMLAGIGLNEDPFTNTAPEINLTTETQTFTLQLAASDFGGANSRVLFDMGAAVGTVVLDNVSLVVGGDGSDSGTGGGGDTPTEAAPTPPTRDAADVISLFSNAYANITVDTFFAGFSAGAGQTEEQVAGDDVLRYADLDFAGVETINTAVDLTSMTNFSIDVWTATEFDFIAGIVDFAGDGFDGGNDTRGDARETLQAGQWTTIDVTIADLQAAGLTATPADFSQLILDVVDVVGTVYIDNIYFYNDTGTGGGGDTPTEAAPTPPTRDAADVISLFSNAYSNITVDTFFAGFSAGAGQTEEQVAGDDVLRYADLDFAGVETINTAVDLTSMTNFSIDVWTATEFDFITGIVDFAGDGFDGGNDTRGDARETLQAGQWTTIDVTIADLQAAGLTATPADFSQLILDVVDVVGTVYIDNIYFYNDGSTGGGGDTPTEAAPTPPTRDAADVISLFSNAYANITVDTFFAGFSAGAGQTEEQVAGDDVLRYADLDFAGVETISTAVDLTMMTNFSIDVWTATGFDFISGIVDFGGDGFGGANPDTRGDVRETLQAGQWTTIDVTIADLQAAGLTATPADFSQLILDVVDVVGTVYIDNIYFYNDGSAGGGGTTPSMPAPTPPMRDAADVISLFSNAYANITVDTFFAGFSAGAGQTNEQVAGDDVLRYADLDFAGVETISTAVDLTSMTNFSIDVWTATGFDFISGIVDFGGDGFGGANPDTRGDVRETLQAGQWTTIDVTIADLQAAGLTATPADFSQLILDVVDVVGTVYIDNIYFYNDGSAGGGGTTPSMPAPTPPMRDAADVISLFSNAYANITVDTFFAGFSAGAGQTNEQVAGDDVLRYADLDFAGVETISTAVDLTSMTNFSIDVWTATGFDFISGIVDFGGDGFGGANPDTRGDVRETLQAGQWTTIDVTIADLQAAGLTATPADFSQLILDVVDVVGTVYVDNIYFYNNGGSGGGGVTALSALPADFENGEEFSAVFEPANVNGSITANVVSGGINTSANVYTFNKPAGGEFFGGMENVFATPLDLTTTRTFRVQVYSTKPNVVVRFELQTRPNGPNFSIDQTVTNANEWVELTFDFNAITSGDPGFNPSIYNAIVIIPDFDPGNDPTTTSETYYIDNIILE